MHEIAQYIFLEFLKLPLFFSNGVLFGVIIWFVGLYLIGFIFSFFK